MDQQNNNIKHFKTILIISIILILGVLLVIVVYFLSTNPNESDNSVSSSSVLVTDRVGGGLCFDEDSDGAYGCNTLFTIFTDGKYETSSDRDNKTVDLGSGEITTAELNNLKGLINQTDFSEIKRHPFTDTCPTAYDGSASTYTFYISESVTETIGSCQYELSDKYPIFSEINRIEREYQRGY